MVILVFTSMKQLVSFAVFECLCFSSDMERRTCQETYLLSNLQGSSRNLNVLVRSVLSDKKQEEIPMVWVTLVVMLTFVAKFL